jgi:hypothetical protein
MTAERKYNIFRWYRSGWGRYTQADPIGLAGGIQLFSYTRQNPVKFNDKRGLVCGVYWWESSIDGFWGSFPSIIHQLLTWPGGALSYGAGPDSSGSIFHGVFDFVPGAVNLTPTPKSPYETKHDTYLSAPSACPNCPAIHKCLNDFAAKLQAANPDYCALSSSNCQGQVSAALSACGLDRNPPVTLAPLAPQNCVTVDGKQVCAATGI